MLSSKNRELRLVFEKRSWNVMPYSKYMKYTAIKWNSTKLTTRNLLCIGYQRFFPRVQHEAKSVISHRPTCLWQKAKDMHERKDLIKTGNCTWKASGTLSTRSPNSVSHQFGSTGMVSPVCVSSMSLEQPFMAASGLHLKLLDLKLTLIPNPLYFYLFFHWLVREMGPGSIGMGAHTRKAWVYQLKGGITLTGG